MHSTLLNIKSRCYIHLKDNVTNSSYFNDIIKCIYSLLQVNFLVNVL